MRVSVNCYYRVLESTHWSTRVQTVLVYRNIIMPKPVVHFQVASWQLPGRDSHDHSRLGGRIARMDLISAVMSSFASLSSPCVCVVRMHTTNINNNKYYYYIIIILLLYYYYYYDDLYDYYIHYYPYVFL